MARPVSPDPTEAELQVLQVIWQRGPSTLRQIHEALPSELSRAAVFSRLEAMVAKRLLTLESRSKGQGGGVYTATHTREGMVERMFGRLKAAFGGSSGSFMQSLLRSGALDERELRELRELIRSSKRKKG